MSSIMNDSTTELKKYISAAFDVLQITFKFLNPKEKDVIFSHERKQNRKTI